MVEKRRNVVALPVGSVLGPLAKQIKLAAAKTENVFLSPHARKQMWAREITDVEVFKVLRIGVISGVPWHEPEIGGLACKVTGRHTGGRWIGVVTVVIHEGRLIVKTVEWEDRR
jgi:hypothetical protein